MISFEAATPSPFVAYLLNLAGCFSGVRFEHVDPAEAQAQVDVYYGNDERRPCGLRIPYVERYGVGDVPRGDWPEPPAPEPSTLEPSRPRAPFPFDVFAAARFWLADEGNAGAGLEAFDEHERLLWARSAQEAAGVREVPIVNAYLLLLRTWVARCLGVETKSSLPPGKRCVVVLSHDVDRPIDPTRPGHALGLARASLGRNPRRALKYGAVELGKAAVAYGQRPRPRHWIFHELADAEEAHGFRSTFFFAATSRFAERGHDYDVAYDVAAPEFRRISRELHARGWEVGLHEGYRAREGVEHLVAEKERLEDVVGAEVLGGRHHYWHTGYPFWGTLEAHAAAGLRYDSSVAFNDAPGYRLGIALPFRPWNPLAERAVDSLQVPPMMMDGNFFYRDGQTVEETLARAERLIADLKRHEGVAAVDWHQETSLPLAPTFRRWGEAYLGLLELLAADPEVSVQTFPEVLAGAESR